VGDAAAEVELGLGDGFAIDDQLQLLDEAPRSLRAGELFRAFTIPPLSVLDRRQGYWQDRRRAWLSLGIESELGRGDDLTFGNLGQLMEKANGVQSLALVSIFDPVICELVCRWYCAPGSKILDPFAGGSVRGVVAGATGRAYNGIDLSAEQVAANRAQADAIFDDLHLGVAPIKPLWACSDALAYLTGPDVTPHTYDLVWTCHPAGTRISTRGGIVPIEAVAEGDEVLTHRGRWRPVTDTLGFAYDGAMVEIDRAYRAMPLRATADHLLLVWRDGETAWRYARDVRPGDALVEPMPTEPVDPADGEVIWTHEETVLVGRDRRSLARKGAKEVVATPEAGRLVGYYIAEGSGKNSAAFAFGPDEDAYIDDVCGLMRSVLAANAHEQLSPSTVNSANRVRPVGGGGKRAAAFFSACGRGAHNKRFPDWVWRCSNVVLAQVVVGAWRGDGTISRADGDMTYNTTSANLAEDMRRALLRLGIVSSVKVRERSPTNYSSAPAPMWSVEARGEGAYKLAGLVGWETCAPKHWRQGRHPQVVNGLVLYPVRNVQAYYTDGVRDVYNLEVADDHSYLAEGVASHNCPPYADLERYSDDPRDLSVMSFPEFRKALREVVAGALRLLKPNRFAAIVIGDVRDPSGRYRNLVGETTTAFLEGGASLYGQFVIIDPIGTAQLRAPPQFTSSRKAPLVHQHLLLFVKGDPKIATQAAGALA
jgi:hypothetical protein